MNHMSFIRLRIIIFYVFLSAILLWDLGNSDLLAQSSVDKSISDIIHQSESNSAFWSISVKDSEGNILVDYNAGKSIQPASNLKLFTSAAVLNYLGTDFRYETKLLASGKQQENIWNGDLIFIGSGDPTISGEFYDGNRWEVFEMFKEALKEKGINEIRGDLVADISYFDDEPYPKGWSWDDLSFYYAVEIGPLSFNENCVDLTVRADKSPGNKPEISWFPNNTDYVTFINRQIIRPSSTDYDEYYRRKLGSNTIILRSELPQGYLEKESLSVHDPALFFLDSFKTYIQKHGIELSGRIIRRLTQGLVGYEEMEGTTIYTYKSPPMDSLIKRVLTHSDNFYTEMLLKTVAAEEKDEPGSTEKGIKLVRSYLADVGIDTTGLVMKDGSGMAAGNFTNVDNLSTLLLKMEQETWYDTFRNSLSVAGVNGTLKYRFKNSPLRNNFHGKSGFLSGVSTLSGYLSSDSGKELIVSMAANNVTANSEEVDMVQRELLEWFYYNL